MEFGICYSMGRPMTGRLLFIRMANGIADARKKRPGETDSFYWWI
jgi:hypothetical protein